MEYNQFESLLWVPNDEITVSSEYIMYNPFYRQRVLRRLTDLQNIRNLSELQEFPIGSMLHLVDDNMLMTKPIVLVPDVNGMGLTKLPYKKFMYHVTAPPAERWVNGLENFVLPATGLNSTLLNFRRRYQHYIRTVLSLGELPDAKRGNVQSVISYASLYRARILGLIRNIRRFNYVMACVLNQLAAMPDRIHMIPIPVGSRQFDRQMFVRTWKGFEKQFIKYQDDPWFLFCMHLIGFVHADKTDSLFEHIPDSALDKIHFILYTKNKMVILRLDHLKEFNGDGDKIIIRLINLLNLLASSSSMPKDSPMQDAPIKHDISIDESLPKLVDSTTPFGDEEPHASIIKTEKTTSPSTNVNKGVDTLHEEQGNGATDTNSNRQEDEKHEGSVSAVDSTTDDTTTSQKRKSILRKDPVIPHSETQRKIDSIVQEVNTKKIKADLPILPVDDSWLEILPDDLEAGTNNAPEFKEALPTEERQEFDSQTTTRIDEGIREYLDNHPELTPAQRQWAEKKAEAYKSIPVGDTTVGKILDTTVDINVDEATVECLESDLADPSMCNSSIAHFDSDYNKKLFTKDLVSVASSFNKVGMFVTDIKAQDCSDPLNNSTRYSITYEDIEHKKHTVNFVLPDVDDNGYFYVNGTYKILKKQRVPLPICKVSAKRVTLNSDYNKYLVERNTQVAHSFINYIDKIISHHTDLISCSLGTNKYDDVLLPYEYTALAAKYTSIAIRAENQIWSFSFEHNRVSEVLDSLELSKDKKETIIATEHDAKATWAGYCKTTGEAMFFELNGTVLIKDLNDEHQTRTTFMDFLSDITHEDGNQLSEWTDFKLLNILVPSIVALCYRYGLSHMLNYTKVNYRLYEKGVRIPKKPSDVVIRFEDQTLVIPRAPLTTSLLFAGLNWFDLKKVQMEQMDTKDIYYDLLASKGISIHNLKGIDNYFDYFVDPITADVLNQMREPTNAKDLLIRATQLLATEDHKPAASSVNFRYRSYERINSAIYKVLTRAHATYVNKSIGATHKFSISDYEIKQLIVQDQLVENVDYINPINDIKYATEYSHAGFGGRQSIDTFMVEDRQFPADGVGIISEATIDSGKTAYAAALSVDPTLVNLRGMTITQDRKTLKPTQIISPTALLVPGVMQDDGKRLNFVNIHLSHYVETAVMEPYRVRTGYGKVVAHRTKPPFAYCAEEDGKIVTIDDNAKVLKIVYKSGRCVAVNYGESYTKNGGGGFYCTQSAIVNNFKQGDTIHKGDVVIYNENFFTPDPYSKQVDWNIGATANVAFIEQNHTLDDGNAISANLAAKLAFRPVHVRDIVLKTNTTVHTYEDIGTEVKNIDPLLVFDQSAIDASMFGNMDEESTDLLIKLNRQTPKAKFTGKIVQIDAFFKCNPSELSPSLKKIVDKIQKRYTDKAKVAEGAENARYYSKSLQIKYTDRIGITDIDNETIILRFYIQQNMGMDIGSKLEILSSLKTVCSYINPDDWDTDDPDVKVNMMYSEIGVNNRIINSPKLCGMSAAIMERLEKEILQDYFG